MKKFEIYTEEFPPYNYTTNNGKVLTGCAVDLLTAVFKTIGAPQSLHAIKVYPWARGYVLAQKPGLKNMIFSTTKTDERLSLFKWVGPIDDHSIVLFAKKDSKINIFNKKTLKNYRYASIRNDIGAILLASEGIPTKNIKQRRNFELVIKAIDAGRADMISYSKNGALRLMRQYGIDPKDYKIVYILKQSELYYAFNLSVDDKTVKRYQQGLDKVKSDPKFMETLREKYLGCASN
ncbi:substrate-binding periplasmic protein [Piscirickettsia litoralis]|uniref:substrate-binding periplasmic protein n=1 Tax=Piscirickettsia litoralis TaxID=1891921 RepID=UPI001F20498C|nr:ABC transporter substrate-binding protein [Piscirickettsia litoralis]